VCKALLFRADATFAAFTALPFAAFASLPATFTTAVISTFTTADTWAVPTNSRATSANCG
jgi:hypothetical protein